MLQAIFLSLFAFITIMAKEQMSYEEHSKIHIYNHKPLIILAKKRAQKALARLSPKKAKKIAFDSSKERARKIKLLHQKKLLFYRVYTKHFLIDINAFNGKIIKKEKR